MQLNVHASRKNTFVLTYNGTGVQPLDFEGVRTARKLGAPNYMAGLGLLKFRAISNYFHGTFL